MIKQRGHVLKTVLLGVNKWERVLKGKIIHNFMTWTTKRWWESFLADHLEWWLECLHPFVFCYRGNQITSKIGIVMFINVLWQKLCLLRHYNPLLWFSRHANKWVLEMSWLNHSLLFLEPFQQTWVQGEIQPLLVSIVYCWRVTGTANSLQGEGSYEFTFAPGGFLEGCLFSFIMAEELLCQKCWNLEI